MRLNWFAPLPPARTEIGGYTVRVLPALARRVQLILWTDQAEWDPSLEYHAEVRRYDVERMPWADVNRGDLSLYHIGNNPLFHGAIWQVSRRHAGLVVLHDLRLHHFFAGLYVERWRDRDGYLSAMERLYGAIGRREAEAFWRGELTTEYMSTHYPLTPLAVEGALAAIVHSEVGIDALTQACPGPVVQLPLPYPASPRSTDKRRRAPGPPYRIIIFGLLGTNRRLGALLDALASLPERAQFRLDIYGQLWDEGEVRGQIRLLGLQDLVTIHGFVSEAELEAALEASHLAVNLRYPTMGEASGSQLRIWDAALPSLVTRVGWYASLPDNAVAFVRPEYEVRDIQEHLRAFLADPERFMQMGENGRRVLEERHAPAAYAQALVEFAAQVAGCRPAAAVRQLAQRLSAELAGWANLISPTIEAWLGERAVGGLANIAVATRSHERQPGPAGVAEAIREARAQLHEEFRRQRDALLQALDQAVAAQDERQRPE
jgi:glycosyltransferase involved in cell wall biosynthesis